ncbi:unnamed protein product [Chironomus riparius]|uniref:Palmitoyltransferase n=1 Tax=Chironomus riparius TaxID=315576 RepID=A0A9N9WM63_9DIPT|nr:unnamed protein product [Chironomus riparius]
MKFRKSIISNSKQDIACSLFLFFIIPTVFYYEIQHVLAEIHGYNYILYTHIILGCYLVFNIVVNLMHIILIDTSVFSTNELMTTSRFKTDPTAKDWNLCDKCELIVPPRSWHCDVCNVCILKRDHHCMFAGNCVGLNNNRYFMIFLLHFFIGATYSFFYNSYYIWIYRGTSFIAWFTPFKMFFPMFMMFFRSNNDWHLFLYMLIMIGSIFTGVLLVYHMKLIVKNATTHEKNKGAYDLGRAQNLKIVFGDRWLWSIFWPFAESTLPEVYWNPAESQKSR